MRVNNLLQQKNAFWKRFLKKKRISKDDEVRKFVETDLDIDTSIFWHDKWWTQCSSLPSSLYVTHFVKGGTSEKAAAATTITLMFLYWYRFVLILRKECNHLNLRCFPPEGDVRRPEAVLSEVAVGGVRGDAVPQRDVPRLGLPIPQQVD